MDSQIRIGADGAISFGTGDAEEQAARLSSAVALTDVGYTVEAAISLAGTGGPATFHGLDFQVNDASGGERIGVVNWANPTGLGYSSTSHWGVGQLIETPAPVEPVVAATPDRVRIAGSTLIELTGFEPGTHVVVRTVWGYGGWLPIRDLEDPCPDRRGRHRKHARRRAQPAATRPLRRHGLGRWRGDRSLGPARAAARLTPSDAGVDPQRRPHPRCTLNP